VNEHITLIRPGARAPESGGISAALPPDLLEQVRGRVRLLAILLCIAFALDPLVFVGTRISLVLAGRVVPSISSGSGFALLSLAAAVASAGLWLVARQPRVSSGRLLNLTLAYEAVICLVIALSAFWQFYRDTGTLPNPTWVPAVVILFPLIMPGPPRRMLAGSIVAAAMAPLGLALLDLTGTVPAGADAYFTTTLQSAVAVMFASIGARVIYRLGRQVAEARELGSYRLEGRLGAGGMGEVWRARHRMLARPAAVKLIRDRDGALTSEARARFEREAQVTAGLRSPHTVELFDFGVSADGAVYYAMELLDGVDGDALVRRFGPIPPARAVHVLTQMCHSLSEAHAQGLVHRDIKPANVMLCRYGEERDFVKVLDFGLVTARHELAASPALTRENMVHGTPAFIAPEQALGQPDLDGRVDIYATGCVAYWLLTGQMVFEGRTPFELISHHARTPATPPSARTELPIPPALDRLILSCLAKDRADRPQTARELAARLAELSVGPAWTEARAREWWDRHRPNAAGTESAEAPD
jgi:serine/threonine-protein kinase